jgi:glycerophosphoryl diester phosphodiesterase
MAAFSSAVEVWCVDMLETDARLTSDGFVVLHHDATVDRTTDGEGPVSTLTLDELSRLDAGYRFRNLAGEFSFRGQGVRIPLLGDVLEAFPDTRINVETKCAEVAGPLIDVISRAGAEERVLVAAEFERKRAGSAGYSGPWGASAEQIAGAWLLHRLHLGAVHRPGYDILQIPEYRYGLRVLSKSFLEAAHGWNIPVHMWVVDEEDDMRRMLEMGVDGIQTDRPDIAARVFTEVVGRPPPPGLSKEGTFSPEEPPSHA